MLPSLLRRAALGISSDTLVSLCVCAVATMNCIGCITAAGAVLERTILLHIGRCLRQLPAFVHADL